MSALLFWPADNGDQPTENFCSSPLALREWQQLFLGYVMEWREGTAIGLEKYINQRRKNVEGGKFLWRLMMAINNIRAKID
jgi:hypothetical protein